MTPAHASLTKLSSRTICRGVIDTGSHVTHRIALALSSSHTSYLILRVAETIE